MVPEQPAGDLFLDSAMNSNLVIPVVEEQLRISTELVESGRVLISKKVHEETETIDVPLLYDQFDVERVAVNRYVETPPAVRYEGETMIIPVLREVAVVEKRLMLVEELHVVKRQLTTTVSQEVTLRKEDVTVTRVPHREGDEATE